ncbi:SDR family oxidoreductase [Allosalinactinospora lopnorensis]|uniref:SDR family oxidoreductase n=1 Tax=Allosalinactinospora lopnorensis TaxID=1352348 RepID=UPI000623D955|nr:SDR family oxidoreductase [Allosalinactinospora lopnorensis]
MDALGNVLITGGASGLGAATAAAVAEEGGRPLIIDRSGITEDYPYARADLADRSQAESAVHRLAQAEGGIDAVFAAAGVDSCGALDDVPTEDWERVVKVNLLGTAAVVRAALPYLKEREGAVVTCSSTLGLRAVGDATAYCASKFGVIGFTRALAAETAGQVRVTLLVPGGMHTAFFDGRPEQYRPPADAKLNQPEHVARAVLFALRQPAGCEVRELVVCASEEGSWP